MFQKCSEFKVWVDNCKLGVKIVLISCSRWRKRPSISGKGIVRIERLKNFIRNPLNQLLGGLVLLQNLCKFILLAFKNFVSSEILLVFQLNVPTLNWGKIWKKRTWMILRRKCLLHHLVKNKQRSKEPKSKNWGRNILRYEKFAIMVYKKHATCKYLRQNSNDIIRNKPTTVQPCILFILCTVSYNFISAVLNAERNEHSVRYFRG